MKKRLAWLPVPVIAVMTCGSALAAHADETLVAETNITGLPPAAVSQDPELAKPIVSKTYYKAGQWRNETRGAVLIAGGADGKMYNLNPAMKTYYVMPASPGDALANNPILAMMKFRTKVDVHPAGETKIIAGKSATNYKYSATIHISMGDGDDPSTDAMLPTIRISGEKWTSDPLGVPLPPFLSSSRSGTQILAGPLTNGMKDLTTQLATIKGFPLLDVENIAVVFPDGSPFAAMAGDSVPTKMTVKQTVTSISDAPLSDDLFHVPSDYKLVDAPPPPSLPLPGGGAPPAAAPPAATPPTPPATTPPPAAKS